MANVATDELAYSQPHCRCLSCLYSLAHKALLVALKHRDPGGGFPQRKACLVHVPSSEDQGLSQHQ